jgi:CMP-N-acetylneuraminic acid synthetase
VKKRARHYALVPAKEHSGRCRGKNWRKFLDGLCLVDFTLAGIPSGIFEKVIVSTDKRDYKAPAGVLVHRRDKRLAAKRSCVKDLISILMAEYGVADGDYLWLLNPTSPFRSKDDYRKIKAAVDSGRPPALVSAAKIIPYIWKNGEPQFATAGKRRNTDDFGDEYSVENGMFYVMNAGYFRKHRKWYGRGVRQYLQDGPWSSIDIDTEGDFLRARMIGRTWKKAKGIKDA